MQRLADLVIQQERRASRAARRLHDDAGPALTGIGFQLSALGLPREQTVEIREALEAAMTAVREVSNELHSNVVERSGLAMAVERLVDAARSRTEGKVTLEISNEKRYDPELAGAVFRVLEESLDNAIRHAYASVIQVRVHAGAEALTVEVSDDGVGFDPDSGHGAGLMLAQARAAAAGLKFIIESGTGQGTIVKIQTS